MQSQVSYSKMLLLLLFVWFHLSSKWSNSTACCLLFFTKVEEAIFVPLLVVGLVEGLVVVAAVLVWICLNLFRLMRGLSAEVFFVLLMMKP